MPIALRSFIARHPSSSWSGSTNIASAPSLPVQSSIDAYEPSSNAICCCIRPLTTPLRPTMFKWNKTKVSSGEPITPKLGLARLPDSDSWRGSPAPKISPTTGKSLKYFLGRLTPDRRAETPHPAPVPSHRRKEAHVPRLRTVSLSKHDDGAVPLNDHSKERADFPAPLDIVLLKPHKASPPSATYVKAYTTPSPELEKPITRTSPKYVPATVHPLPLSTGTRRASNAEPPAVPLKSALKSRSFQTQAIAVKQEFPPVPLERHASLRKATASVSPPKEQYVHARARSRGSSVGEWQRPAYPILPHQTPSKYVPAVVKVAMKGEAIAVSWPLADYASRSGKGTPSLYFDAGFDPRKDAWAVRVDRGGFWGPIKREEADIPVSPHTSLTEMTIDCVPPRRFPEHFTLWPIHVRRSNGLRCIDIFRGIFDTYNVVLTEKERARLGADYLKRCEPAFKQRCKDAPGLPLYNEECGMRRVDVLRGRRIFKAVAQDSTNTRWLLYFDDY
ncbi:hypothetical protein NP233_g2222 [Leucocoprinus birnbaumii]|uniref:DUF6699 domain-containing protein n=1 Tax=Leucocoprinus birnbaumii TaxID=56174 RepID=A0AAD5YZ73_9AGAR|nr:hypothetical protein NP233_g2222 [Leucocoprinus birnbaumii]